MMQQPPTKKMMKKVSIQVTDGRPQIPIEEEETSGETCQCPHCGGSLQIVPGQESETEQDSQE